ncbi:MAG TPA: antibiotic biosynthesis monooxygenase family protein [Planctomycetia bacterium]|nr:antibiotic biosynthesis monooxygenase family protein [Planctomycetia bacterium]
MIYLNVLLTANDPADCAAIADALRRAGELSQKEPGCERWEAYQADAEPTRFLLVERWESESALDGHRKGEAYLEIYSKEVIPKVKREPLRGKRLV